MLEESCNWQPSIPSRHCLLLGLGRYLIVFDPLTLVLDQWKHNWQMLSQQLVFDRSKNFTSDYKIQMPPIIPITHFRSPKNQANTAATNIHHSMLMCSVHMHARNTLISSRLIARIPTAVQSSASSLFWIMQRPNDNSPSGWTDRPQQKLNYEHFNRSNFNIHYWSWNYRGCWHQTCPPIDTRKGI